MVAFLLLANSDSEECIESTKNEVVCQGEKPGEKPGVLAT
jgi:hypothetical protein